jgi:GT2 family glycosyltransferase
MAPIPELTAVVVTHNSRAYVERSLSALEGTAESVVLVDAGSTDGSAGFVRERFPDVDVVELENVGYGAAANAAMSRSGTELVLVTNADAWPVADALEELAVHARSDERIGVAGPALVSRDGVRQPSLIPFPTSWWTGRPAISVQPSTHARPTAARHRRRPSFLVGAVLLLRRAALDDVGGFDPGFFMYSEDVDLCWRLHRRGWKVELVEDAQWVHVGGASSAGHEAELYVEQVRAHLRFLEKNRGAASARHSRRVLRLALRVRKAIAGDHAAAYGAALGWLESTEAQ